MLGWFFVFLGFCAVGADLVDRAGQVIGYATVIDKGSGLILKLTGQGLPVGWHAMHIHTTGDCSDFTQGFVLSGSHLNPHNKSHGVYDEGGYHAGDLANIYVGYSGEVHIEQIIPGLSVADYRQYFVKGGPALIIHQDPDDYSSQPTGDAGARIACAVLPAAKQVEVKQHSHVHAG